MKMTTDVDQRDYLAELKGIFHSEFTTRSWARMETHFDELNLPWLRQEGDTKERYVARYLSQIADDEVIRISRWYLVHEKTNANAGRIRDLLDWLKSRGLQRISEITRRAILQALENRRLTGRLELAEPMKLAGVAWRGDVMTEVGQGSSGLFTENPLYRLYGTGQPGPRTPLSNTKFLKDCGFLTWPDTRVIQVLETLVAPSVREGVEQSDWIALLAPVLKADGYAFQQRDTISGRPIFQLVNLNIGVAGKPKNLIFASIGPKPELGFADAINNEIVVLKNADSCLIYDRPLSDSGLLWTELIAWWSDLNHLDSGLKGTRQSLGKRLLQSTQSEPEKVLFKTYFKTYLPRLRDRLPALVPQVYLHYDPKTLNELQGKKRIPRQRMDFLLLLERGARVVLEVDGRQHYADSSGKASSVKYAEMARADRGLRLGGYEIYRFGGNELSAANADAVLVEFFDRLFARHEITLR
jgi:very-short-patch-repair endonuclease